MLTNGFEIRRGDPRYPALLDQSPDPPERLYGRGDPGALGPCVAIVGARKATPYGLGATRLFSGWCARAGYGVVSGAALGCDQEAQRAVLAAGGRTIAVLAGGADVAYPAGSARLLDEIATHGAVVSEHPWGTRPQRWTFRTRNRIIAGLSVAVLVVEAGLPSGTFSTADEALRAGREVLAVPGAITSPESRGSNRLISQGATLVADPTDLMVALEPLLGPARRMGGSRDGAHVQDAEAPDDPLLTALRASPLHPDDLALLTGRDVVSVVRGLNLLEARGLVARRRDGRFVATVTTPPVQ